MEPEKQHELSELSDEVDIILSYKDTISQEEIHNFVNKFSLLSEGDIRKKIQELTGDITYTQEFHDKVTEEKHEVEAAGNVESNVGIEKENLQAYNNNSEEIIKQEIFEDESTEQIPHGENAVFDSNNIPEVSFIKAEIKYGQLSLDWGWPNGINKAMLCYRMDRFPMGSKDSSALQILMERKNNAYTGDYIIDKVTEGNYYFCIYTLIENDGKMLFSEGQRRLVTNKLPEEIFYEIKMKRNILGKLKGAELILSTNRKEINLPGLVLVGRAGNMPLQKSDGESLIGTDYQTLKKDEIISFNIPIDNIGRNMYVKLFFLDDVNSKMYRIVSPAKEKLHFR
ncbi:hypothetical protein ACJDU8_18665 [Clostridium sp. WILCCON 0269]|uniref:Uncharacterized protein n=1 Tax=Candidatus Clostridium eludens TaxID=3381663 RepID=A0ABW8SNN0_9CLOT